ncbi:hypothetical protein VPH35_115584 [Triticum aestivum]|uniref:uncharacterized protein n=1 Tax=Triticum aestivum TaxID=4565 RepID=UPI001D005908|nr:uncharacterized protein LOC123143568 [Triticum aestivum]
MPVLRARPHLPRPNMLSPESPPPQSPAINPAPLLLFPSTQRPVAVGSTLPLFLLPKSTAHAEQPNRDRSLVSSPPRRRRLGLAWCRSGPSARPDGPDPALHQVNRSRRSDHAAAFAVSPRPELVDSLAPLVSAGSIGPRLVVGCCYSLPIFMRDSDSCHAMVQVAPQIVLQGRPWYAMRWFELASRDANFDLDHVAGLVYGTSRFSIWPD